MNINDIAKLMTLTETDTEVEVKIGWSTVAHVIEEEPGQWFVYIKGVSEASNTGGFATKAAAWKYLIDWYA